eukprot:UN31995
MTQNNNLGLLSLTAWMVEILGMICIFIREKTLVLLPPDAPGRHKIMLNITLYTMAGITQIIERTRTKNKKI